MLRGVNLALAGGERLALLGANGAGKTTLLRILAGLTRAGAGTVRVEGLDLARDGQQVRRMVGFVAHSPYVYEELTALENLLFFAKMYAVRNAQERARGLLQRVGLERRMHERAHTLSRGQGQRLALARALLHEPRLLLLDEPDTGLDQEGNALLTDLLVEHSERGGATIFTTHALERSLQSGDRVALLYNGRIAFERATSGLTLDELRLTFKVE